MMKLDMGYFNEMLSLKGDEYTAKLLFMRPENMDTTFNMLLVAILARSKMPADAEKAIDHLIQELYRFRNNINLKHS